MKLKGLEKIELYTQEGDSKKIYAAYEVMCDDDSGITMKKFVEVDSRTFESYLRLVVIPEIQEKITADEIVRRIKDYNEVYGIDDVVSAKVRTAGKLNDGLVEYALYDGKQQYVSITEEGYEIVGNAQHKFLQKTTNAKQVYPKKSDKNLFELLEPYVSATKNFFLLFVVWLVQCFCEGNHSAMLITAEAGSGKSTVTKMIRRLIDPSMVSASILHGKTEHLLAALSNSYMVAFDNTDTMTKEESDIMCVAVTGGNYTKREAYTTNELAVYCLHNTILINGIEIMPSQSDFAQRCLCVNLKKLNDETRKTDGSIEKMFQRDLPYILDAIFKTISKAMKEIKTVQISKKPRMLDSYIEMLAIAIALGIEQQEFEKIYFENIDYINKMRANDDFVYAVDEYMNNYVSGRSVEDTAAKLYAKIRNNYSGSKHALPSSASIFSRRLKREYSSFLAAGYIVNVDDTLSAGTIVKIIKKK